MVSVNQKEARGGMRGRGNREREKEGALDLNIESVGQGEYT